MRLTFLSLQTNIKNILKIISGVNSSQVSINVQSKHVDNYNI